MESNNSLLMFRMPLPMLIQRYFNPVDSNRVLSDVGYSIIASKWLCVQSAGGYSKTFTVAVKDIISTLVPVFNIVIYTVRLINKNEFLCCG